MRNISTVNPKTFARSAQFEHRLKSLFLLWFRNYRTRKALNRIEPHRLRDIGVDAAQAKAEHNTPFWR
ncbi:DUF1127 domain-containing protein [Rhodobacteraceae bacterium]|nr:DUF1127 domain-containing protein [Paracoccaceae bacterium]